MCIHPKEQCWNWYFQHLRFTFMCVNADAKSLSKYCQYLLVNWRGVVFYVAPIFYLTLLIAVRTFKGEREASPVYLDHLVVFMRTSIITKCMWNHYYSQSSDQTSFKWVEVTGWSLMSHYVNCSKSILDFYFFYRML